MTALPAQLDAILPTAMTGSIVRTEGLAAAVAGLPAPVGAVVEIERLAAKPVEAEVIGFRGQRDDRLSARRNDRRAARQPRAPACGRGACCASARSCWAA